jgi:glycosyltransferase involved in cell wall biosynthesis
MEYSVIIVCYNTLTLLKQTLEAVLDTSGEETEIILVNNHPPFDDVISFLRGDIHSRVRVVDPGRNLGPFDGQQYGRQRAGGRFLVHVDDDTIVPRSDWLEAMRNALVDHEKLAFVSLFWMTELPADIAQAPVLEGSNYRLVFWNVDVPCTMLEGQLWKKEFSNLSMNRYYYGTRFFYHKRAKQLGKRGGYLISHWARHLSRSIDSDLLYGAWKVLYAKRDTDLDYGSWRLKEKLDAIEVKALLKFGYVQVQLEQLQEAIKKI